MTNKEIWQISTSSSNRIIADLKWGTTWFVLLPQIRFPLMTIYFVTSFILFK